MKKGPLSLVKREPASDLTPFEAMERRVEELLRTPFSMMGAPWWTRWAVPAEGISPTVDIFEEGADIVVKAEIPGMKKEDIHVDIDDRIVTIRGEKKKEEKVERKNYARLERTYGSFVRTFDLPAEVETEKARASFRDGVLEVRVPKVREGARRSRKVAVA